MFRTALVALALVSAPALATSHYQAEPAAKPSEAKLVLRDTVWKCGDAGCAAAKSNSRPTIVCAVLAKEVGALRSFSAGGKPLAADELEKCNSRAN
jgi:hypothetical protein